MACGTCAELEYKGNVITVNVVDKGQGVKGWFDLGGPAWRALTGGMPPGRVFLAHTKQKVNNIVGLTALRLALFMGYE